MSYSRDRARTGDRRGGLACGNSPCAGPRGSATSQTDRRVVLRNQTAGGRLQRRRWKHRRQDQMEPMDADDRRRAWHERYSGLRPELRRGHRDACSDERGLLPTSGGTFHEGRRSSCRPKVRRLLRDSRMARGRPHPRVTTEDRHRGQRDRAGVRRGKMQQNGGALPAIPIGASRTRSSRTAW
jgi:hypothetical protein